MTYHRYTFSTLGFAKNASVVKLKPKMATVQATAAERKLMAELEQMKVSVEEVHVYLVHAVCVYIPLYRTFHRCYDIPNNTQRISGGHKNGI